MKGAFPRLFVLVTGLALLTSRAALLVHEFGGHAAPASLFGGKVLGWYLFAFAGGRVSYRFPEELGTTQRLVVTLGGIAIELAAGAIAFAMARKKRKKRKKRERRELAFCLSCVGVMLVGHAAIYLARGVHYGFGDGAFLGERLGGARVVVVALASALALFVAAAGGRQIARWPASLFAGSVRKAAAATLLVFASAGLAHGALALAEVRFFPDPAWVAIMENASVVRARAEVAARVAAAKRQGEAAPSREEQERMMAEIERARRAWPLDPVLGVMLVIALVAGVRRGAREQDRELDPEPARGVRALVTVYSALAAVIAVILVLRRFG